MPWRMPLITCNRPLVFLLLFLIQFGTTRDGYAENRLVINTSMTSPLSNTTQTGFLDLVLQEALRKIGYTVESVLLPAERSLINANAGQADGEQLRIARLQKTYPNLIQVPEPLIDMEFVVFTRMASFEVKHWDSLKPYAVAFNTGWKILERNVPDTAEKILLNNEYQLFSVLMNGRTDVIIYSRWLGLGYIKQHQLTGIKILNPPLARRKMYTYLHKKYQNLVPKLAKALRAMKSDGRYQTLFQQTLSPYCEGSLSC